MEALSEGLAKQEKKVGFIDEMRGDGTSAMRTLKFRERNRCEIWSTVKEIIVVK